MTYESVWITSVVVIIFALFFLFFTIGLEVARAIQLRLDEKADNLLKKINQDHL